MKRKLSLQRGGFTFVELMGALAITSFILGGVALCVAGLNRSFWGSRQYIRDGANSSRLIDYVSQDLRNAVGVSKMSGGLATVYNQGLFEVDGTNQLVIFVPDYYLSNIPDNSAASTFKTGRRSRSQLGANTTFAYDDVTDDTVFPRSLKFQGNIEVRYVKKARSTTDNTPCYFRQEYEGGTLRREQEISEFGTGQKLLVNAINARSIQLGTSFSSKWTGEASRTGSVQFGTVYLVNRKNIGL